MAIEQGGNWFQNKYGVNLGTLDRSVQELVHKLGEDGVAQLVKDEKVNAIAAIERLERFKELGGRWDDLSKSVNEKTGKLINDEPQNWINAEEEKYSRLLDD